MMNRWLRDSLVLASALTLIPLGEALAQRARRVHIIGCAASTENMDISALGKIYRGGVDPRLAIALHEDCNELRRVFRVGAVAIPLQEHSGYNAFAADTVYPDLIKADGDDPADFADGTVFIGLNLITHEFKEGHSFAVPTILAHEFAHIMQNKNGFPYRGKWSELHSDYMAGWYTAYRKQYTLQDPKESMASLVEKGDTNFNSPGHHGTPRERGKAFLEGYMNRGSASEAYSAGLKYIRDLRAAE